MFEIEWINNQGDREMNDVKMQKAKREWVPFTVMSEQLLSMQKVIEEKFKVQKPLLTKEAKEGVFDKLLMSLLSEKEILLTYFENGYILTSYMTVVHINPLKRIVMCTDAFYRTYVFNTADIIEIT
ncbi:YolD-like family protein [Bacillus cereus]|uniref:YolD-like family protein n=1 Tax=Bacillus cereus TaxID=1396 RepID=UPI001BB3852A|nr:YolD-like family protein [Bacillus cereus]QUW28687.1 YolD-like family protein [Bacillus cereus]